MSETKKKKESERTGVYITNVQKIDMSHLLSKKQIELVRTCTKIGDIISFRLGEEDTIVGGTVKKTYDNIFVLDNGRSYTWIDYILGSPQILDYLHAYHPIRTLKQDVGFNYYRNTMHRQRGCLNEEIS